MAPFLLSHVAALGFLGVGQQHLRPAAPRAAVAMATPRVPYTYRGMEGTPVWINLYDRMYRERIMFLSQPIEDSYANTIIAVLLYLETENAKDPAAMYANVNGGATKSGLAIYDTMRMMPYPIQTVNMGMCSQVGTFLVAGGTKGKRYSLPNALFRMDNPGLYPRLDEEGRPMRRPMQATEMQLEVEEVIRDKKRLLEGFSEFTGRSVDQMRTDMGRDFYLSAPEAVQYGLIDSLLKPKRPSKIASKDDVKFSGVVTPGLSGELAL